MDRPGIFGHRSDMNLRFFPDCDKLADMVETCRKKFGIRGVVFTGGVWDLIHPGHLLYLEAARAEGQLLVVGVDTDELARSRKKKNEIDRPVIPFDERVLVLSFQRPVDLITVVHDDIMPILQAIRPDVLVVSTSTKDLPSEESDKYKHYEEYVGRIHRLQPQAPPEMVSSTARIRGVAVQGLAIAEREIVRNIEDTFKKLREEI
jgi:cytidyltransferase-like protein